MTLPTLAARISLITIALTIGLIDGDFYVRTYGGAFGVLPLSTNLSLFKD